MNHQLPNNITADMVVQLPGDLKDRRTPLGEPNWKLHILSHGLPFREKSSQDSIAVIFSLLLSSVTSFLPNAL